MDELRIGTSGWYYADWIGPFYPRTVKKENYLAHYARTFQTTELNTTFYHLPLNTTAQKWIDATPEDFLFAVKASRLITHLKRLHDVEEPLRQFLNWAALLKEKLGPILFQLPPNWDVDRERLEKFLSLLPDDHTFIIEFRDPRWLRTEVYDLLRRYNVGLCLYDKEGIQSPQEITSSAIYVRFHGTRPKYHGDYSRAQLEPWANRIRRWRADGKSVYVYFNNDYEGHAIKNALLLREQLDHPSSDVTRLKLSVSKKA